MLLDPCTVLLNDNDVTPITAELVVFFLKPRGCDPKVIKSFLKNFEKTSLKEMFQIKQQFGKLSTKYREEGTKRM